MSSRSTVPPSSAGKRVDLDPKGVGRSVGSALIREVDPSKALKDLRLPVDLVDALRPPLKVQGYEIVECSPPGRFKGAERTLTVVTNDGVQRSLIHIPRSILGDPQQRNLDAVNSVPWTFEAGTALFVFSRDLDAPKRDFRVPMLEVWKQVFGIQVEFVPWSDILEFQRMDDRGRAEFVRDAFRLSDRGASPIVRVGLMTGSQKERLCQILVVNLDHGRLGRTLDFRLSKKLDNIVKPGSFVDVVYELVSMAEMEGWADKLVQAVCNDRPDLADLLALAQELGLATAGK